MSSTSEKFQAIGSPESAVPLLEARSVSFGFRGATEPVLQGLAFKLMPGERVAIMGPTGSGKSLLLKILVGLLAPTRGEVFFRGKSIHSMHGRALKAFRRSIGMTFQKDGLFDSMTCGENLRLPLWEVERVSGREADKRVEAALESVELSGQEHLRIFELSGGMQKRLGIARALLFRPEVVLYDEPTAGLDPITSSNILQLLGRASRGSAVVIVSSEPNEVERVTDLAAFLSNGKLGPSRPWLEWRREPDSVVGRFIRGKADNRNYTDTEAPA